MHLDLIETNRLKQVEIVRSVVLERSGTKPMILTGDWNATPESATLAKLREFLTVISCENARTFHAFRAEKPRGEYCIDYIAVDSRHAGNVRVTDAHVTEDLETSDHNPVSVALELKKM